MRRLIVLLCLCLTGVAAAQENPLTPQNVEVVMETDVYGQAIQAAEGVLVNQGEDAYRNISLYAEVYGANDTLIGEGFGYPVNACGAGLLPDFALQPGQGQAFAVPLDVFEDGEITRVEITAQGEATTPAEPEAPLLLSGITQVSSREIAAVEWLDEETLRYSTGCWRDIFTTRPWYTYNVRTGVSQEIEHPAAQWVNDALRLQLGLEEDLYFAHSMLSYPPDARRMVYQTELNTIITAEPDGSFKRVLFNDLSNRTLQRITWLRNGNFIASYYGAAGDPVMYFTATVEGRVLSEPPANNPPSLISPGADPDGARLVIATEVEGETAYFLKRAAFPGLEMLFKAEAPGNNWPGPLVEEDAAGDSYIYVALPVDSEARLNCFNLREKQLYDLSALPLELASDERGWWALSPEANTIALGANGVNGGLWLIDLNELPACQVE